MGKMQYVRHMTLRTRGSLEGGPDEEVTGGPLLVATQSVLAYEDRHSRAGHDDVRVYPAFHGGTQVWMVLREWSPAIGYSAWGSEERILPFEEGVRLLAERGVFRLPQPAAVPYVEVPPELEGTFGALPREAISNWLDVEGVRAMAAGDMQRVHFINAARNGEPGELEAILAGRPSPGLRGGTVRRRGDLVEP